MNTEQIFATSTPEEREKLLHSHAVHMERTTFKRSLTDDELQILSADYIRGNINLKRMEGEAKEIADQWKTKIKEQEAKNETALEELNSGQKEVVGVLFSIPDHAAGVMRKYDKDGELIEHRPLKKEERQARAFIDGPNGTVANPDEPEDIAHEEVGAEEAIEKLYEGPTIAGMADGKEAAQGDQANVVFGGGDLGNDGAEEGPFHSGTEASDIQTEENLGAGKRKRTKIQKK